MPATKPPLNTTIANVTVTLGGVPTTLKFQNPIGPGNGNPYQGDQLYMNASVQNSVLVIQIVDTLPASPRVPTGSATSISVTVKYNGQSSDTVTGQANYSGTPLTFFMTISHDLSESFLNVNDSTPQKAAHRVAGTPPAHAPFGFVLAQQSSGDYTMIWMSVPLQSVANPHSFTGATLIQAPDDPGGLVGPMGIELP